MLKVLLKKKDGNSYIVHNGLVGFGCAEVSFDKAHRFTHDEARDFVRKYGKRYGYLEFVTINDCDLNNAINVLNQSEDCNIDCKFSLKDIAQLLSSIEKITKNEKEKNYSKLLKLENAMLDLNHYRELNINSDKKADVEKIDEMHDSLMLKRREIKDNLRIINLINNKIKEEYDIKKELDKMNNRKYTPRILNQLFDTDKVPDFNKWWKEIDE